MPLWAFYFCRRNEGRFEHFATKSQGSTSSRFHKQSAVKSLRMPHRHKVPRKSLHLRHPSLLMQSRGCAVFFICCCWGCVRSVFLGLFFSILFLLRFLVFLPCCHFVLTIFSPTNYILQVNLLMLSLCYNTRIHYLFL